jgi:hypothetical protein
MATRLNPGGIAVDVTFKDIKDVHLSVYPLQSTVQLARFRQPLRTARFT